MILGVTHMPEDLIKHVWWCDTEVFLERTNVLVSELLHESLVLAITKPPLYSQPGPHPPSVPSSSSPAECQDQSKLCISLSQLGDEEVYCKLK